MNGEPVTGGESPYRWLILAIAWLSFFALSMAWYVMPTLQPQLLDLYDMTARQYSTALTIPFLAGGILGIAGGMLADRLGLRRAASLGVAFAALGIAGRSYVAGFASLAGAMAVVGIGLALLMPNLPKLVSIWFPPEETGLATGIYNTGLMGGLSTGLVIAPFLPEWRTANLMLGGIILVLAILVYVLVRDAPPGKALPPSALIEGLGVAIRSRSAWSAAFGVFCGMAGMMSIQAALPAGLHEVYGLTMATGGRVASLISYLGIAGALTLPALADRFNARRAFLVILVIAFPVAIFGTWLLGQNTSILWIGTIIAGYLAGGSLPLFMEVPAFLPRIPGDPVGPQHVGGAAGLLTSLMSIGGFASLPFIVMPVIVSAGYTWGFFIAALIFAAQAFFAFGIEFPVRRGSKEVGHLE